MNFIERPLDLLNMGKDKKVSIRVKNNDLSLEGILLAFDIHINLVIDCGEYLKFIKGELVEDVSIEKEVLGSG